MDNITSTEYSKEQIDFYSGSIKEGEGQYDLTVVKEKGINSKNPLDYYCWKALEQWFKNYSSEEKTIKDLQSSVMTIWSYDYNPLKPRSIDITSLHHHINKFQFVGLLKREIKENIKRYSFETMILNKGLDWFREGNIYLKGLFQSNHGFFQIM